jgi:MFS family permease
VITGLSQMWIILVFALLFGLADAFFYPAMSAILPQLVPTNQLEPANALIHGSAHLSAFVGPALAGTVIALFAHDSAANNSSELMGVGLALLVDSATFLTSVVLISKVSVFKELQQASTTLSGVLSEITEGIRFVWGEVSRRTVFLGLLGITFLITAPLSIGLPVLADQRLTEGAAGLGAISAAYGLGAVCGNIFSATTGRPTPAFFGPLIFALLGLSGACVGALSMAYDVYSASAMLFIIGAVDGYIIIHLMSWFQRTTPLALMGRVMSLMMFAIIGLAPVTQIAFGALIEHGLDRVLLISGGTLVALCTVLIFTQGIRRMGFLASDQLSYAVQPD